MLLSSRLCKLLITLLAMLWLTTACGSDATATPNFAATTTASTTAVPVSPTPTLTVLPTATLLPSPTTRPTPADTLPPYPPRAIRWLNGIPCKPPCWEGIIPGKTTAQEAQAMLAKNPLFKRVIMSSTAIEWKWADSADADSDGSVYFDPKTSLVINIYSTEREFTLSEVIKIYGPPSYITANQAPVNHEVNRWTFGGALYWASQGFHLSYGFGVGKKPVLSENLVFSLVSMSLPGIENNKKSWRDPVLTDKVYQKWEGFKDFSYYCNSEYAYGGTRAVDNCDEALKTVP